MAKKKQERSRGQTLGASYRAASTAAILATPAAVAVSIDGERNVNGVVARYRSGWKETAMATGVRVADEILGQKILGHNSALGRGSLTAWAPEVFAVVDTAIAAKQGSAGWPGHYARVKTGFAPGVLQGFQPIDKTALYFGGKVLGGVIRKLSNVSAFATAARPVKKMLGSAGGAL